MRTKILLTLIAIISTHYISAGQVNAFFFYPETISSASPLGSFIDTASCTHWRMKQADHYNDVTYIGYVDRVGPNNKIITYNHTSGFWSLPRTLFLAQETTAADHAVPCVTVLRYGADAGKILYVINEQGGDRTESYIYKSENIADVTSWLLVDTFSSPRGIWSDVSEFEDGSLIHFFREAPLNYYYARSFDQGNTWSTDTLFLTLSGGGPYIEVHNTGDVIHLVISHRIVNSAAEPEYQNIYYLYSDDYGYTWKKRGGTEVSIPLDASELDTVYVSETGEATRDSDIFADSAGNPYILIIDDKDSVNSTPHYKFCAYSDGWSCDSVTTTATTVSSTGQNIATYGCFDPSDNAANTVILSGANFQLAKWVKNGAIWEFDSYIRPSPRKQVRPIFVKNAASDLRVIWYESEDWISGFISGEWGTDVELKSWPVTRIFRGD